MIDPKVLKTYIEESHERCKKHLISLEQVYSNKILSKGELQKKFAKNRNLILTALPYMDQLINFVKGSSFFALLTDGEGCILNAIGDEKILSDAFAIKMIPGAYMDEENIGTNSMSIVMSYKRAVQISGKDHFIKAYHKWTCSGAPILNNKNELIGILNLTGYTNSVHPHTLGMVVAASKAIEEMIKVKAYNKLQNINNKYINNIFAAIPVAIMTSDINGRIKVSNKKAIELFGDQITNKDKGYMKNIISDWEKVKDEICLGNNVSKQISLKALSDKFIYNFTANPFYNSDDDDIEIVYVFVEVNKIKSRKSNGQAYYIFDKIIGEEENFIKIIRYAKKISDSKSTILIMGESGTGKEVFAQSIHNYSSRVDGPFIALNCGAIPKQLIESELFGYEEGAFTGAKKGGNLGKFELASGGTILLDEIGEMPLDMQIRLLRVVQEGVITRIGSSKSINVDVRIIASTNKDLKREVELGRFRKDLFYRLNVLPIFLPPLRERKSDIPILMDYFIKNISKRLDKKPVQIPERYLNKMINYSWPGNIRELENVVELIINTEAIPSAYFGEEQSSDEVMISFDSETLTLKYLEKKQIIKVLKKFKGNITYSSDALGIRRNTLYSKIKKYDIDINMLEI